MLLDELTRERLLVKSLREENGLLRGNITALTQCEAELADLSKTIGDKQKMIEVYKSRQLEQDLKFNELKVNFQNYKELVEIEKVKLNQAKSLPIVLAGLVGGLGVYALLRANMELDKQQMKYMKFELDQMWMARVNEVQSRHDELVAQNEALSDQVRKLTSSGKSAGWLTVGGVRLI